MRPNAASRKTSFLAPTKEEIRGWFSDPYWSEKFPPLLNVRQAADLAQVPLATIYDWSSRGHLECCSSRVGKHLRIQRDRFIAFLCQSGS